MLKSSQICLKKIYKHPSNFNLQKELNNDNDHFSHTVFLVEKMKKNQKKSLWFAKCLGKKRNETLAEILMQETMRLILPQQPKTRRLIYLTKEQKVKYYVLSKKIPEFDDRFFLSPENNKSILDNNITGLAATQVLALWLNEVDFKTGNVGIDPKNKKVIKIDGGFSFIQLNPDFKYLHHMNFKITSADLEALPNLINYQACNWLGHILWDKAGYAVKKEPSELDKQINQSIYFKNEIYQTILRIISLPDQLIRFFVQSYIITSFDVIKFSKFMIARKNQLTAEAEKISAFNTYRKTEQAREGMLDFLKYLETFKTMEKYVLLDAFREKYNINIKAVMLRKFFKGYRSIEKLDRELDNHLKNLKYETTGMSSTNFIFKLESLKEETSKFLATPTLLKKGTLHETLTAIIREYEKNESSMSSDLIKSINKVLSNHNLKKSKNPMSTSRITKTSQRGFSTGFFNTKPQETSTNYYQARSNYSKKFL